MAHDAQVAADDIWIGAVDQGTRTLWMSPIIIGIAAPIILGLVVAPQILDGAAQIVTILLAILLVLAIGAYILSVVAPGEPGSIVVRAASKTVSIVRHGLVANSEVDIAFAEITRLAVTQSADPDGYQVSAIELRTRGGETWSIPGEVDAAELAHIRRLRRPLIERPLHKAASSNPCILASLAAMTDGWVSLAFEIAAQAIARVVGASNRDA